VIGFAGSDERATHVLSTPTTVLLYRRMKHTKSRRAHNQHE